MKKMLMISILIIASISIFAVICDDESSAAICDDIKVYIQNPDQTYTKSVVNNVQTIREAVNLALEDQNRTMKLGFGNTNPISIDDISQDNEHYWRIFQWLSPGSSGWTVQTFTNNSDQKMISGTTYCINFSTGTIVDGTIVYSKPSFEPISEGYVFIRFANGFAPDNEHVNAVFTPEIRQKGFWLKGSGSNMGMVLFDAVDSNWPGEIELISMESGNNSISLWISSLFGLSDTNISDDVWAYWSQWTWKDHQWVMNENTLGYYDPAVYKYVEVIFLISTPDPYGDGYVIDKGGEEPNPEVDEIICLKNKLNVEFKLDNETTHKSLIVNYGNLVDMNEIDIPSISGKGFVGWGDTTQPITQDTVFIAEFVDLVPNMVCVTYTDENDSFIRNEFLISGSSAKYDGIPSKKSTKQYHFVFEKWDADLTSVTSNITVKPIFKNILREYEVSFYNYDRTEISKTMTIWNSSKTSINSCKRTYCQISIPFQRMEFDT